MIQFIGNDLPYLLVLLGIIFLAIFALLIYSFVVKVPSYSPSVSNVTSLLKTGIGMDCNQDLQCDNGLQCNGGKCYVALGGKCSSIYDCVIGAEACSFGVCVSSIGGINYRCDINQVPSICNPGLGCFNSVNGDTRCLVPNGQKCLSNTDCALGSVCSGNVCTLGKKYAEPCVEGDICEGNAVCVTGYCQPPGILPFSEHAYCSNLPGFSGCQEDVGGIPLVCNVSESFPLPTGTGVCARAIQTPSSFCNMNNACVPFSFCNANGVCDYPALPNTCDVGTSYSCTQGFECVDKLCLAEIGYPCNVNDNCDSGTCEDSFIYSIQTRAISIPYPTFDAIYGDVSNRYPFKNLSSYNSPSQVVFIEYPFSNSDVLEPNTFVYYTSSQNIIYTIDFAVADYTFTANYVTLLPNGQVLIGGTVSSSNDSYYTVYVTDLPTSTSIISIDFIPLYTYNSKKITDVSYIYYDPEFGYLYMIMYEFPGVFTSQIIVYGTTSDVQSQLTLLRGTSNASYVSTFGSKDLFPTTSFVYVLYLESNKITVAVSGNPDITFTLSKVPVSVGYIKSSVNTFPQLILYYVASTGEYFKVILDIVTNSVQEISLPGVRSIYNLSQDYLDPHIVYISNRACKIIT